MQPMSWVDLFDIFNMLNKFVHQQMTFFYLAGACFKVSTRYS